MTIAESNMTRVGHNVEELQRWCEERNTRRIRMLQSTYARTHFQRRNVWLMLRNTAQRRY